MDSSLLIAFSAVAPFVIMLIAGLTGLSSKLSTQQHWRIFKSSAWLGLAFTLGTCLLQTIYQPSTHQLVLPGLAVNTIQSWVALLVQLLGTVIGVFSSRYMQGEARQPQFIASFAGVLASVHLLVLADHWLLLIAAWAAIGLVLQQLLCFYQERPFAMLAAHKKFIADRIADVLLLIAASLAWWEVGSGSLTVLSAYVRVTDVSLVLQISAVLLVLAVIIRTALFPVHGWLIQVMEAPTPVSALLHAGVVNLAGYVLIRFSALIDTVPLAKWLLVFFGLATAILAGLVMMTRISIKVKLAWSTVAQMGFMVLECGLGLYTLAAMHLLGHSLYKAHAFLSASTIVQQSKLEQLRSHSAHSVFGFAFAPLAALGYIMLTQHLVSDNHWPWWWSVILAFAWAPILWAANLMQHGFLRQFATGTAMITGLAIIASLVHEMPLGTTDSYNLYSGVFTAIGMLLMYITLVLIQLYPKWLSSFQRWSYAGFYVDEAYTRLTLKLWPIDWVSAEKASSRA